MNPEQQPSNSPKPVAYDQYGRPLYAHPPATPQATPSEDTSKPQVVYMTRAVDPHQQEISPDIQQKHEESTQKYPYLNLSEGEFVISAIKRHPIGLLSIWAVVAAGVALIFVGASFLLMNTNTFFGQSLSPSALASAGLVLLLTAVLFVLGGIIATVIYEANRFYLTNESVIQHIQTSLFSRKDQTISLANIEDASYRQRGILQSVLNYGAIRLSTEGEETTYRFNLVANPKREVDMLNNAVEAFKNYRPVSEED
jgi:uncharacterized membrane protein YdbT with pleckstrin-like domain